MVRELFTLYATDHYSMKQIENLFWEKGYRNHNGKSTRFMCPHDRQPKYKGYYVGNVICIRYVHQKAEVSPARGVGDVQG